MTTITQAVPAAKYALSSADGNSYYKVDRPTKGKWAGYTFVSRLVGAPGNWRRIRITRTVSQSVLDQIALDSYSDPVTGEYLTGPRAASVRYAREHKRCSVCDATLSDPVSEARGMGPVCAARF